MTVEPSPSAARRHRTTIYRTAQRLARQAEACSAGIYCKRPPCTHCLP